MPNNQSDLKPFKHGEEGTHSCCHSRLEKEGGKARCCYCVPHEGCELNQEQWEKIIDTFLHQLYEIAKPTKENIGFFVSWEHDLKETIRSLLKSEREKLIKGIKNGTICSSCGEDMEQGLSEWCGKCLKDN